MNNLIGHETKNGVDTITVKPTTEKVTMTAAEFQKTFTPNYHERHNSVAPHSLRIHIGIDPGTNTGFAIYDRHDKKFLCVTTITIHEAMFRIVELKKEFPENIYVRFEDARLRKWLQNKTTEQLQGAGSIKRDCTIWQDFLNDFKIPFACVAPHRGMTKWTPEHFYKVTGWVGRTSNHARDAAVLVWGR